MNQLRVSLYDDHELDITVLGDRSAPTEFFYVTDPFLDDYANPINYLSIPDTVTYILTYRKQFPTSFTDIAETIIQLHRNHASAFIVGSHGGAWMATYLVQNYSECIGNIITDTILFQPMDIQDYLHHIQTDQRFEYVQFTPNDYEIVSYFDGADIPRVYPPTNCLVLVETKNTRLPWTTMSAYIRHADKVIMYNDFAEHDLSEIQDDIDTFISQASFLV